MIISLFINFSFFIFFFQKVIIGYEKLIEKQMEERENGGKMGDVYKDIGTFLKTYTQYVTDYTATQVCCCCKSCCFFC